MTKINRSNYEIFFLDYYEGKLSEDKKTELFSFLNKNPDLRNEFESFEMIELPPAKVFYDDKDSLKRELITEKNYQQYLIAKIEGDLTKDEQNELNKFLFQHPEFQKEEKLYALTKLAPDVSIVFAEKSKLKKAIPISTGNRKAFYFSIAAAACILLLIGVYFLRTNTKELEQANNEIKKEVAPIVKNNDVNVNENKTEKENIHKGSADEKNNSVIKKSETVEKSLAENKSVFANNLNIRKNQKKITHKNNGDERMVAKNKSENVSPVFETIDPIERKGITQIEMNENIEPQIAYVNINLLKQELNNATALNSYLDQVTDPDSKNVNRNNAVTDQNNFITGSKKEKRPFLEFFAWTLSLFSKKDVMLKKSYNEHGDMVAYQLEAGKFKIGKSANR